MQGFPMNCDYDSPGASLGVKRRFLLAVWLLAVLFVTLLTNLAFSRHGDRLFQRHNDQIKRILTAVFSCPKKI